MNTVVSYKHTIHASKDFLPLLISTIKNNQFKQIGDIGGGANPHLPHDIIKEHKLNYTLLDISEFELQKAPDEYKKICIDIAEKNLNIEQRFDFLFSKMLAEHVKDAKQFHTNVFQLLAPGGMAVHFFPTLYTFPFFINRLMPETIASFILNKISPRENRYQNEKFPAYYKWCWGPTKKQIKRFESLGFEVIEYRGFFGHEGYYTKLKPLQFLHKLKTQFLLKHPQPQFTSFAYIILKKPK
jgi:2-polyprenyl-3-methyl-5-hydroxy-6-metoxy-1,4-benzoquinol methylase